MEQIRYPEEVKADHVERLLNMAEQKAKGKQIRFCGKAEDWLGCMTVEGDQVLLWFNVGPDTHLVKTKIA